MSYPVCPRCHKEAQTAEAAFCAYCGAPIQQRKEELSGELKKLLEKIQKQQDPVKKHKLIEEGVAQYPESLELAEEKLYLGRLYERSTRTVDFSVIKCFVWHLYLTPEEFSAEKKAEMRREIVAHPDLMRCLELADNREVYMRRYLERLAQEFVNLFLKGSSRYNGTFLGFRLGTNMGKTLANPMTKMLRNIHGDMELTSEQREQLYDALYRAFLAETGNASRWLDENLTEIGLPVPVKL